MICTNAFTEFVVHDRLGLQALLITCLSPPKQWMHPQPLLTINTVHFLTIEFRNCARNIKDVLCREYKRLCPEHKRPVNPTEVGLESYKRDVVGAVVHDGLDLQAVQDELIRYNSTGVPRS